MYNYEVEKTWGNERGLSCCFRQHRATHSHCSKLHGYSLGVKVVFTAESLDRNNWVIDFGSLTPVTEWLKYVFDHTCVVAGNDPYLDKFKEMSSLGLIDLRVVERTGCEAFANLIAGEIQRIVSIAKQPDGVYSLPARNNYTFRFPYPLEGVSVKSVTVFEHGANSATFNV
jgi:6-pyruvoyltetrahydropterin/6-carboxytetrahydropterin synthase